jgi:hypothetical protein
MDIESKIMGKGPKTWWSWKSPVGLGIFLSTAALALVLVIYSVGELIVVFSSQAMYQSQSASQGMMQGGYPSDTATVPPSASTK